MNLIILTPIFNDWESFGKLSEALIKVAEANNLNILRIVGVNDCSSETYDPDKFLDKPITILNLNNNMGHQRAIAIGLAYVNDHFDNFTGCVVMDSDGEDSYTFLPSLCKKMHDENGTKIVFAGRKKRIEGFMFRIFYHLYKILFWSLTGKPISFGNFSCIPRLLLKRLVRIPELWLHYSGSIIKSRLPYTMIPTHRSARYFGKSKMNFERLAIHGLSSIAIYINTVSVRILIFSSIGITFIILLILLVVGIKFFTDLAIPGWASNISLILLNFGGLFVIVSLLITMIQLNWLSNPHISIHSFYKNLIYSVETID